MTRQKQVYIGIRYGLVITYAWLQYIYYILGANAFEKVCSVHTWLVYLRVYIVKPFPRST